MVFRAHRDETPPKKRSPLEAVQHQGGETSSLFVPFEQRLFGGRGASSAAYDNSSLTRKRELHGRHLRETERRGGWCADEGNGLISASIEWGAACIGGHDNGEARRWRRPYTSFVDLNPML